jgi:hypothetical protein
VASSTAQTVTVFTCPGGSAAILKSIYGYYQITTGQTFVKVVQSGGVGAVFLVMDAAATAITLMKWEGWIVLEPGDQVQVVNSGGTVQTWGSGALLPLGST